MDLNTPHHQLIQKSKELAAVYVAWKQDQTEEYKLECEQLLLEMYALMGEMLLTLKR